MDTISFDILLSCNEWSSFSCLDEAGWRHDRNIGDPQVSFTHLSATFSLPCSSSCGSRSSRKAFTGLLEWFKEILHTWLRVH